ncbi:Poly [ADP-ribose] polymerase 1 [Camellia lanceoleosa]|uniref:Poly [ADP-ribose] polymerase 1 n=1 Tax=Camellia lanceoleosa TaxID=1840588 RepID=A0ACC0I5C8_9ERIC|nr:Poly [ADP-ribose] polymerase 1 [Camellia lanceoleosa]
MTNPIKHRKAEYAKSRRSFCKSCKNTIDKGNLKLGKMVHATQFDGFMHMRNHAGCILKKATQFHVQMDEQVWSVNVSKFGDESQHRPAFELVCVNSNGELSIAD